MTDHHRTTIFDPGTFRHHDTRDDVAEVLRHGHWIPATRGITRSFLREHHPGWEWGELKAVYQAAGVIRTERSGGMHQVRDDVVAIHYDTRTFWLVEWEDGSITCAPTMGHRYGEPARREKITP